MKLSHLALLALCAVSAFAASNTQEFTVAGKPAKLSSPAGHVEALPGDGEHYPFLVAPAAGQWGGVMKGYSYIRERDGVGGLEIREAEPADIEAVIKAIPTVLSDHAADAKLNTDQMILVGEEAMAAGVASHAHILQEHLIGVLISRPRGTNVTEAPPSTVPLVIVSDDENNSGVAAARLLVDRRPIAWHLALRTRVGDAERAGAAWLWFVQVHSNPKYSEADHELYAERIAANLRGMSATAALGQLDWLSIYPGIAETPIGTMVPGLRRELLRKALTSESREISRLVIVGELLGDRDLRREDGDFYDQLRKEQRELVGAIQRDQRLRSALPSIAAYLKVRSRELSTLPEHRGLDRISEMYADIAKQFPDTAGGGLAAEAANRLYTFEAGERTPPPPFAR